MAVKLQRICRIFSYKNCSAKKGHGDYTLRNIYSILSSQSTVCQRVRRKPGMRDQQLSSSSDIHSEFTAKIYAKIALLLI